MGLRLTIMYKDTTYMIYRKFGEKLYTEFHGINKEVADKDLDFYRAALETMDIKQDWYGNFIIPTATISMLQRIKEFYQKSGYKFLEKWSNPFNYSTRPLKPDISSSIKAERSDGRPVIIQVFLPAEVIFSDQSFPGDVSTVRVKKNYLMYVQNRKHNELMMGEFFLRTSSDEAPTGQILGIDNSSIEGCCVLEIKDHWISLQDYMDNKGKRRGIELHEQIIIEQALIAALQALHKAGFKHNNLTPDNILINTERFMVRLKNCDIPELFISNIRSGLDPKAIVYPAVFYGAPETLLGEKEQYTSAADIFSLGWIFVEMFMNPDQIKSDLGNVMVHCYENILLARMIDRLQPTASEMARLREAKPPMWSFIEFTNCCVKRCEDKLVEAPKSIWSQGDGFTKSVCQQMLRLNPEERLDAGALVHMFEQEEQKQQGMVKAVTPAEDFTCKAPPESIAINSGNKDVTADETEVLIIQMEGHFFSIDRLMMLLVLLSYGEYEILPKEVVCVDLFCLIARSGLLEWYGGANYDDGLPSALIASASLPCHTSAMPPDATTVDVAIMTTAAISQSLRAEIPTLRAEPVAVIPQAEPPRHVEPSVAAPARAELSKPVVAAIDREYRPCCIM